jgi:hypothetical protein
MQFGRDGEDEREKEGGENTACRQTAEVVIVPSHRLGILRPENLFARFCLPSA